MKTKRILTFLAAFLLVLTLANYLLEFSTNRWLRLFTSLVFLFSVFQIVVPFKRVAILTVFASLVGCDFLLLEWEFPIARYSYYALHSFGYLILIYLTIRELRPNNLSGTSFVEIASLFVFFLINSWILFTLEGLFSAVIEDARINVLFYINGFLIIFLVIAAFFYSTSFSSRFSSLFFLSILGLTISDLMIFSIYFLGVQEFRYIDNILYIFGLFTLIRALQEHKEWKKGEERISSEKDEGDEKMKDKEGVGVYA